MGDPRIRYEAVFGTKIGVRFAIARRYPAAYYLTIDDDLILRPKQVRDLFLALLRVPEIPHGIRGEVFVGRAFSFNIWVDRKNLELDILNGCFAFTQLHVDRYFELLRALGIENTEQLGNGKT